jgi:hypothetical protein
MRILAWLLAVFYLANGAVVLAAPDWWYASTPGVADTGPYNSHFVLDVGIAFAVSGALIAWGAGGGGWRLILSGAGFPVGHAVFHIVGLLGGHAHGPAWVEVAGVILPAVLTLGVAMSFRAKER